MRTPSVSGAATSVERDVGSTTHIPASDQETMVKDFNSGRTRTLTLLLSPRREPAGQRYPWDMMRRKYVDTSVVRQMIGRRADRVCQQYWISRESRCSCADSPATRAFNAGRTRAHFANPLKVTTLRGVMMGGIHTGVGESTCHPLRLFQANVDGATH